MTKVFCGEYTIIHLKKGQVQSITVNITVRQRQQEIDEKVNQIKRSIASTGGRDSGNQDREMWYCNYQEKFLERTVPEVLSSFSVKSWTPFSTIMSKKKQNKTWPLRTTFPADESRTSPRNQFCSGSQRDPPSADHEARGLWIRVCVFSTNVRVVCCPDGPFYLCELLGRRESLANDMTV